MMGETIAILRRSKTGVDGMGEPAYEWTSETVENCLVKPASGSDSTTSDQADNGRPNMLAVSFTVALPKSYTADKALDYFEHSRVALVSRGMAANDSDAAFYVHGCPMRTNPCPTAWDTVLSCGRTDG